MEDSLRTLFSPRSIAVIGASADPHKIGGRTFRYLKENWGGDALYPVNARLDQVQGVPALPDTASLPDGVEMAFVIIPAPGVPAALEELAGKGVRSVVIFSSGFAEVGREGIVAQRRITEIARANNMRIVGPNCMGVMNISQGMWGTFTGSFESNPPHLGRMSMVSQSGAVGIYCYQVARTRGLGINLWATTGNESDVDVADCLAYMAQDEGTDVIVCYMEGCRSKERLVHALELARQRRKPVIMLKVGRSEVGAMAAASHTASMVGADRVYDAVFEQYGVYRADNIAEMVNVTEAALGGRYPHGRKLGIVTVSGGVGVLMADQAAASHLEVPPMPEEAQRQLLELIPFASARNPVDTTAQMISDISLLGKNLDLMLEVGGYDAIIFFLSSVGLNERMMTAITGNLEEARQRHPESVIVLSGEFNRDYCAGLVKAGYLIAQDPSHAVASVAALARFREAFEAPPSSVALLPAGSFPALPATTLDEAGAKDWLQAAGIPMVPHTLATSAQEAAQAAESYGGPVALKVAAPNVAHKSDAGGVRLSLQDRAAVEAAYDAILASVRASVPDADIQGVLVSPMVSGGVETILGMSRDPVFGAVILFGLGGVFTEIFHDVVLKLAPFDEAGAMEMIRAIRGFPLLDGARGRPRADVPALAATMARFSQLAATHAGALASLDINPLTVLPLGQGVLGLDALVVPSED